MMRTWVIALLLPLALAACATLSTGGDNPGVRCEQRSPEVFALNGDTDEALVACVSATFQPTTRELILDSPGGNVALALDIAAHFEGRGLAMRVVNQCNSSCANYFLPLAARIVVEPGAYVIQHGSIDPMLVGLFQTERDQHIARLVAEGKTQEEAEIGYNEGLDRIRALSARQDAFSERNGVPPGWLLRRYPGSNDVDGIEGGPSGPARQGIIVEHRMMASCLTNTVVEPYSTRVYGPLLDPVYNLVLLARGLPRSGDMVCIPET